MKGQQRIVGYLPCLCGCGRLLVIKAWHLNPSRQIPNFIKGHQQFANKRGWKGGKIKSNGYWHVYKPNHPNANAMGKGYIRQSRLIMEKHLGRYLETTEIVHHINGKRDDDRLENLMLWDFPSHRSYHQKHTVQIMERDNLGRFIGRR